MSARRRPLLVTARGRLRASGGPDGWGQVIAVGGVAMAAGFGQFGVVAALGDVTEVFGHLARGPTIADQAGLSATALGLGLAAIRLASLFGLPVASSADRLGRRRVIIGSAVGGLACTAVAALSPSYWWFVALFALGRPFLSTTNAVAGVMAAEEADTHGRSTAVAIVAACYAAGAGVTALLHSLVLHGPGFRVLCLLALVPLAGVVALRPVLREPDRFTRLASERRRATPVIGAVARPFRRRLGYVVVLSFALSLVSGPGNSFVFLYAQTIVHQSGAVTASMVVTAGATGVAGLLAGRWLSDHLGRRVACSLGMAGTALFALLAYSGSASALFCGYVLGVASGSILAPAIGAIVNELFPTAVRASVAGWFIVASVLGGVVGMVIFGVTADIGNRFALAALVTFVPASFFLALFWLLPETRGREPEELWGIAGRSVPERDATAKGTSVP